MFSSTLPWLPLSLSAGLGPSHGGVPAPEVLYDGMSGPLFHGSQLQSSHLYTSPAEDEFGGGWHPQL